MKPTKEHESGLRNTFDDGAEPVEPDEWDLAAIARIEAASAEDLKPVTVTNPIRKARIKAGIMQTELAEALGISQGRMSQLEREGSHPTEASIKRVNDALKKMQVC